MRNSFWLIFLSLFFIALPLSAVSAERDNLTVPDSLFQKYYELPDLESRKNFVHNTFLNNRTSQWMQALLDTVLMETRNAKNDSAELFVLYDYSLYYRYQSNSDGIKRIRDELKECGGRINIYGPYFKVYSGYLDFQLAQGDTESALLEAEKMEKEAELLSSRIGKVEALSIKAYAYGAISQYNKSVDVYEQLLSIPDLSYRDKMYAYRDLSILYTQWKKYEEAIEALNEHSKNLELFIGGDSNKRKNYKDHLLDKELKYSQIYLETKNVQKSRIHLEKAAQYELSDMLFSLKINYYNCVAGYYKLLGNKAKCYEALDMVIAHFNGVQPLKEADILAQKASIMASFGDYKEASELYASTVATLDSLNNDVLHRHEKVYKSNYKIQKALLDKVENEHLFNVLLIIGAALVLLLCVLIFIRSIHVRQVLNKSRKEVNSALKTVEATNKMKESFLRNITTEIQRPLNRIVQLSDILTNQTNLSTNELAECSTEIRKDSTYLIHLVTDVLDLSRLEAGMMKFNVQQCDVVQLCQDVKMRLSMESSCAIDYKLEVNSLLIDTDSSWFMRMLLSLLTPPVQCIEPISKTELILNEEDGFVHICIKNSPYAIDERLRKQYIHHSMNRLFVEHFGGSYCLTETQVEILYPIDSENDILQ